jgi:hypothetical protein
MGDHVVRRCVLCGSSDIGTDTDARFVFVKCRQCHASFMVEFDPPDAPNLNRRIDISSRRTGPPRT